MIVTITLRASELAWWFIAVIPALRTDGGGGGS
jgi:hypothetical protein